MGAFTIFGNGEVRSNVQIDKIDVFDRFVSYSFIKRFQKRVTFSFQEVTVCYLQKDNRYTFLVHFDTYEKKIGTVIKKVILNYFNLFCEMIPLFDPSVLNIHLDNSIVVFLV